MDVDRLTMTRVLSHPHMYRSGAHVMDRLKMYFSQLELKNYRLCMISQAQNTTFNTDVNAEQIPVLFP